MLNPVFLNGVLTKSLRSSMHADDVYADNLSFAIKYAPEVLQQTGIDVTKDSSRGFDRYLNIWSYFHRNPDFNSHGAVKISTLMVVLGFPGGGVVFRDI